jgi:hypothetical protein
MPSVHEICAFERGNFDFVSSIYSIFPAALGLVDSAWYINEYPKMFLGIRERAARKA